MTALEILRKYVGGCREELGPPAHDKCWKPAEYVLWGKLIPPEGLGPRCYEHAVRHVSPHGLVSRANYALIHLGDLAQDIAGIDCDRCAGKATLDTSYIAEHGWQDT